MTHENTQNNGTNSISCYLEAASEQQPIRMLVPVNNGTNSTTVLPQWTWGSEINWAKQNLPVLTAAQKSTQGELQNNWEDDEYYF